MIDTIKIYCEIDKNIYDKIKSMSIVKSSVDNMTNEKQYEIINDHLEGSFDSRLSVKVDCGAKYQFSNLGYSIEIEGSFHKIARGYNSHDGFSDLNYICRSLIEIVEFSYDIELPDFENWFLQRVDIAICYDLKNQTNVKSYINSLSRCTYPRRKVKFYYDESLYLAGTSSTLKIYNKLIEFSKHDIKKFINRYENLEKYLNEITGFIRFECEIKKKLLEKITNKKKYIKITDINYEMLKNVWKDEFMKLLKFIDKDIEIIRGREQVKKKLNSIFKKSKAQRLYSFYCNLILEGQNEVKQNTSKYTFNRNIKELQELHIDFSQAYKVEECEIFYFNPFESEEVA